MCGERCAFLFGGVASKDKAVVVGSFWNNLRRCESMLKQKSRLRSCREYDLNTRFFHNIIKARTRSHYIGGVDSVHGRVTDVAGVKEEVRRFFEEKYREINLRRPRLDGLQFEGLSQLEAANLKEPFSVEEIRDVVWEFDGNKCPGLDGYNFIFVCMCWNSLEGDIYKFVEEFHAKANLPKAVSTSFIALIPKVYNPQLLGE
ncbi:unnamed protein product [Vicia faba]|uniref:Uncharacterized protein n=1 Tax=Vicia faba TaxID=3906 RepID=A0AAV0Z837_VICFA|nr:unnamed protein product [Vicia faba]